MVSISRIRSRSVRTAPFTLATGFPEDAGAGVIDVVALPEAGLGVASVGACEATTCAPHNMEEAMTATPIHLPIRGSYFIWCLPHTLFEKQGERNFLSPRENN